MNMEPEYPAPPGGHEPELNLAGEGIVRDIDVASGASFQPMPDPGKSEPYEPVLSGSPEMGGIDPHLPFLDLNLAGAQGFPTPEEVARPSKGTMMNGPTFSEPVMTSPSIALGDPQSGSGLNYVSSDEWSADPLIPDLSAYNTPLGLDIHNLNGDRSGLVVPDPPLDDLLQYDVPQGIAVHNNVLAPDPLLPDLQQPDLKPEVEMQERPGDLAPDALDVMRASLTYRQVDGERYPQVFMDAHGMNTRRRRAFTLLMKGLDAEEQGRSL